MNHFLSVLLMVVALLAPLPSLAHEGHDEHPDSPPPQRASQPAASPSTSGLYRWMDDSGRVHYSQGLDSVPEQFRSRAVPLGQATPSSPEPRKPEASPSTGTK